MNARVPSVNQATAVGATKKLYEEVIPMNEEANALGSRNARKIKNPTTISTAPTIMCNIVSAVILAGRIAACGLVN